MAGKGRPMKWTEHEYYRLFQYVIYRRGELGESVRCACRNISQREPWRSTGLSAETLRRRFSEAERLWERGGMGQNAPGLDLNFALTYEDMEAIMNSPLRPNGMDDYIRSAHVDALP